MSYLLYVNNLPADITLDDLIIYFQSSKSGGGDVDSEACKMDGHNAVVAFEEKECLENVLSKSHEVKKHKLKISDKPARTKPIPKKRTSMPASKREEDTKAENERAYLGEVRTVIVRGLSSQTTNQTVQLFFANERRTGGGDIENMERCQPDVANITFVKAEVAARVLKNGKLELEGYLLQLKEMQPELILPKDRKKLYVENINPKTTKDSLMNYMELKTGRGVCDVQFGENGNALVTFDEEPDIRKIMENEKPLEGAVLKISKPPVCNSILVKGLTENTTKDSIEMYFENEKNGGGNIYGDVIHQKEKGMAVVSFCDPQVLKTLFEREHKLNGAHLFLHQHYQFMNTVTETIYKTIKLNSDISNHAVKKCEEEIRALVGAKALQILQESREECMLPDGLAKEIEEYLEQFTVKEIPFCKKLLNDFKDELNMIVTKANQGNITIIIEEELPRIKIVGTKKCTNETYEQFKNEIREMEKKLDVVIEEMAVSEHKLELFLLHGVHDILENEFHVGVKIEPRKGTFTIEGPREQVSFAVKEAYKKCSQIEENIIDLSEAGKYFLESGGFDVLNNGMKAEGLKGMISLNGKFGRSKAKILIFDDATMKEAQSYLSRNMSVKKYSLDEDSLTLLRSNKWKEFCENSKAETSVIIYISEEVPNEISLVGSIEEVQKMHTALDEFMTRNTIIKECVDLSEGYVVYLNEYRTKELEDVETKLEGHSVRIHLMVNDGKIGIDGTKEGVREAKKYMDDIIASIASGKICFDKLRTQEYLESEQGKLSMETIETKHKCLIRLIKDDGERSTAIASSPPKEPSRFLCSYETPAKIMLKVLKDDIVAHTCDVIVNAANGDLKHVGGVAKGILDAGGDIIQEECDAFVKAEGPLFAGEYYSGSPGNLPCKRIIHAVGPRWDVSKREKTRNILRVTCSRVLEEAMNYRSIALPAIGSGIFGIPKETCAEIMIEAAEKFCQQNPNCALKDIRFVNIDDVTCQVFLKKFREKFRARSTFMDNQAKNYTGRRFGSPVSRPQPKESERKNPKVTAEVLPKRTPGDYIITKRNMKISVVVGDLSTYKADVLVNTTGENLQLDSNPCSKALSNEAGPTLQSECTKIGKLQVGQVAATSGGNLLCNKVYHVVCVQWNDGQGEQVLRSIVKNCLNKCNSSEKSSIAFPAIGTGILGFPRDVAAKIFFEESKEFGKRASNCNIKEISFVVYNQDAASIEAFRSELKKQPEWDNSASPATTVPVPGIKKRRAKRMNLKSSSPQNDLSSILKSSPEEGDKSAMCVKIGEDKEIEIVKGDITKETTDVIAHLTNPSLILNSGVGKALARAGGQEIKRECQVIANAAKLDFETTALTTAGQLDVKYVAHMVGSNDPTYNEIEKCINSCLQTVSDKECDSVSFPAVGTGSLRHDPSKAATTILTSITRFLYSSPGSLRLVRVVLMDDDLVTAFQASANKLNEDEGPGVFKRIANFFLKSDSTTISVKEKPAITRKKFSLEIYAKNDDIVNLVKGRIKKILESQNKKEMLEDDNIEKLSKQQIAEIKELCDASDLKVSIENELSRIVVVGHSDDISKTFTQIHKILRRIGEAEKEKEKAALRADLAEIVSQGVQWFYVDPVTGDHEEYDKQTNVMIEKAYSKKEKSVIFFLDDEKCEIVFDKMQETNLKTNDEVKVIRKDLKAEVSVPEYWEAQPLDGNGKELAVHLVSLNPTDPYHKDEYKTISDHFQQTASQQQILQIQRVQNPSLYKLYLIKKLSLDNKTGSNEKFLFHGTSGVNLNEINEKGLNRSFAGDTNGAVYGKGVYFARDASMSTGYAPAMPNGNRYMYYTRVAAGQYAVGNRNMLVPPLKSGSGNDSYDSTVNHPTNPTIFVLFYDNQYYPEYLITFK